MYSMDDEVQFAMDDDAIDAMETFQHDDSEIIDLGYDVYDIDRNQLCPYSTVLLNTNEFMQKVQQLLRIKPRKSILKRKKIKYRRTNDEILSSLRLSKPKKLKEFGEDGLDDRYVYVINDHYLLDYRHYWKEESIKNPQKKLIESYKKLEKGSDDLYQEVYHDDIAKELNEIFIKKYGYEEKAQEFLKNNKEPERENRKRRRADITTITMVPQVTDGDSTTSSEVRDIGKKKPRLGNVTEQEIDYDDVDDEDNNSDIEEDTKTDKSVGFNSTNDESDVHKIIPKDIAEENVDLRALLKNFYNVNIDGNEDTNDFIPLKQESDV